MKWCLIPLMGLLSTTAIAQNVVFEEDFESGTLNQFTAGNAIGSFTWQTTTNRGSDPGHSATNSAYFGDPTNFNYDSGNQEGATLTSGAINTSGLDNLILDLNYFAETENSANYDQVNILVSTDGTNFTTIGNNGTYRGVVDNTGQWERFSFDVSAYTGGDIYIRIDFNTVDNIGNNYEGVYVDDIRLYQPANGVYGTTISTPLTDRVLCGSATHDGGLLVASHPNSPTGADSILVTKLDVNGDTVWVHSVGSSKIDLAYDIIETNVGGYIIAGTHNGYIDAKDIVLVRVDPVGNVVGSRAYGGLNDDEFPVLESMSSGEIVLAFNSNDANNSYRYALLQDDLTLIWDQSSSPGTSRWEWEDVLIDSNQDILFLGNVYLGSGANYSPYILKTDPNGNTLWEITLSSGFDRASAICEMPNGDYVIAANVYNSDQNLALIRINSAGNVVWSKNYQTDGNESIVGVMATPGGNIACGISLNDPTLSSNTYAIYKVDGQSNSLWAKRYGTDATEDATYFHVYPNGDMILSGYSQSFNGGNMDGYVVRTDSNGNTVGCQEVQEILDGSLVYAGNSQTTSTTSGALSSAIPNLFNAKSATVELINPFPTTSLAVTNIDCYGNTNGEIDLTVNGGISPYDFEWSSGVTSEDISQLDTGTYIVDVEDNVGCHVYDTASISEPTEMTANLTATDVTCFSDFNGAVDLTVNGGTPGYTYQWANGATTEDISGLGGGFYQVIVTDSNGCEITQGVSVFEPGPLSAAISNVSDMSCFGVCDGEITGAASGGVSPYNYQWNDPSSQGSQTATGLCEGTYLLTVTDDNGCTAIASGLVSEPDQLILSVTTTGEQCGLADGTASATVSGGTGSYNYAWSSGGTSSTETGLTNGTYQLDVTDGNGCQVSETFDIQPQVDGVDICMVSVDSASGYTKNLVVWDNPSAGHIDGIKLYRNVSGAYSLVGFHPADSISQFVDNTPGIDPNVTSYRYKISVMDTCGNESAQSVYHETIHLTSNVGISGEVNLIWDNYEGFSFNNYLIYRDSTGNNDWAIIDTVPSTNFTYTDLTPTANARYVVVVDLPGTCAATRAINHNTTRSNRIQPSANTSVDEYALEDYMKVYPNPTTGTITVDFTTPFAFDGEVRIVDARGRLVFSNKLGYGSGRHQVEIDLSSMERGIYHLQLRTDHEVATKRVVVTTL